MLLGLLLGLLLRVARSDEENIEKYIAELERFFDGEDFAIRDDIDNVKLEPSDDVYEERERVWVVSMNLGKQQLPTIPFAMVVGVIVLGGILVDKFFCVRADDDDDDIEHHSNVAHQH